MATTAPAVMPARKVYRLTEPAYRVMHRAATADLTDGELRTLAVLALFGMAQPAAADEMALVVAAIRRVGAGTTVQDIHRLMNACTCAPSESSEI